MRRYLIFVVAGILLLLSAIDATAVAVAFPVIIKSFDVSLIMAGWVLGAYQLTLTAILPVAGNISDALGRKVTFLGFVFLFAVGSLLCSVAPNVPSLIAFRVLQAIGGSGFMPSSAGMVADEFPRSRQQAIGLLTGILPVGWMIGPNLGAFMTTALGWRSIFWINIPLCIIALVAAATLMRGVPRQKSKIDVIGSILIAGTLTFIMFGISEMGSADGGPPWLIVALLLGAGVASAVVFWRRQTRVKQPVIEPEVLRGRPFMAANGFNFLTGYSIGAVSLIPLYGVSIYGMTTLETGLILTPRSVGMIASTAIISLNMLRWGYRRPMLLGSVALVPCFLFLALEPQGLSGMIFLVTVTGVMGLANGMVTPAANNACIELMPNRVGTISAVRSMFRQAGNVFGITVGSLLLHDFGIAPGYRVFFIGLAAVVMLAMVPLVFAMPRSPNDVPKSTPA